VVDSSINHTAACADRRDSPPNLLSIGQPELAKDPQHIDRRELSSSHINRHNALLPTDLTSIQPMIPLTLSIIVAPGGLQQMDQLPGLEGGNVFWA
jgi:hypothetical protein